MHLSEGKKRRGQSLRIGQLIQQTENWTEAQSDFFESFRNYDEAGSLQRIQVLKYLVLTTMLMGSDINPFDSQETKPYKNDPRISAMTELVQAYQTDQINQYEAILHTNTDLLADPFIAENIDEVTRNMRTKAVVKLVASYTSFHLDFIAKRLKISIPEVQDIVGFLIMDGRLRGKIDQVAGTVEIESRANTERMHAVADWSAAIKSLASFVLYESDAFKADESIGASLGSGGGSGAHGPVYAAGPDDAHNGVAGGRRKAARGFGT